ncbi:class I SAM-dependent methyltransferase [Glaciihabitans arcticus]|uniref:Class I SAM-dependent methyltransferase n=1 Tax=Glaciihabitans arcticus TaxID=2668039 RepID=A0A4V2JF09_9MICO|nr:class I SAM-dependent methyltransferase [Glaciihabitans arcticus]TBN57659.1 class I SAM-dependent methyltransferase [Glaciihabitans arcticus]
MPIGEITRGTTGTNRLRRVDRWIAASPALRRADDPLVVDLGYGASATTSLELFDRLAKVRPDVEVVGIEIDPARVALASRSAKPGVSFRLGGFEVPLANGRKAAVIRALNVLRQYDESQVLDNWHRMVDRLQPGGLLVEGTCSEVGRVASWVDVTSAGPASLTIALHLASVEKPSIVAERLPKVLIHRNVPGEPVHELMLALDRAWQVHAPLGVYGPSQRWIATVETLKASGWPVLSSRARSRLGELTVAWDAVAPRGFAWS